MAELREQAHSCLGSACFLSGPEGGRLALCSGSKHHGWKLEGDLPGPFRASKAGRTSRNQRAPHPRPLKGRGRGPQGLLLLPRSIFSRASSMELIDVFSFWKLVISLAQAQMYIYAGASFLRASSKPRA